MNLASRYIAKQYYDKLKTTFEAQTRKVTHMKIKNRYSVQLHVHENRMVDEAVELLRALNTQSAVSLAITVAGKEYRIYHAYISDAKRYTDIFNGNAGFYGDSNYAISFIAKDLKIYSKSTSNVTFSNLLSNAITADKISRIQEEPIMRL